MLSVFCAASMMAQSTNGSVVGQVTDPTGAAVARATVTLTSTATGVTRVATASQVGEFTLDEVPIGTYTLAVASPSFRRFLASNVIVNVATVTRVDARLEVGNVSETVEVSATSIQVETESGALGTVVDGTQVKELPLNGRSFVELTQLGPGVSGANNFDSKNKGLQGGVDFSVNGNPTTNNLFLVDGANDNDVGSNRTILIYPSIESIAEFKMLTNSYGPEYGQASGAVISIVTRGGTNAFHGSVFYSGRNDALAAYTYFAKHNVGQGQPLDGKDKLRRNDWGYSIGGPIMRDKMFFFFNEEWNHQINGFSQASCVPSAAERAGDFTTLSCGATAPNIPANLQKNGNPRVMSSVDPAGVLLAEYFPLPNKVAGSDGNNWSKSLPTAVSYRQENARMDFNINKRNALMGRYTQDHFTNPSYNGNQYWGDTPFPVINGSWAQPSKMIIGRWTSTISNSLVNDAEFAYSNNRITVAPGGTNAGLLNQLAAAIPTLYPLSLKTASASTPTIWSGLGPYGNYNNIWSIAPWSNSLDIYTYRDDISKVAARHALKLGAFVGIDGKNEDAGAASTERPTFQTFDYAVGIPTGNPLANVLIPNNPFSLSETSTNTRAQLRWKDIEFYAGDTWKMTPRLTVSYGARYSLLRQPTQPNNQLTSFQPQLYDTTKPASDACNGLWIAPGTDPCGAANKQFGTSFSHGVDGPNNSLMYNNNHLIAPRVGIAWDVAGNGKTSLRAGIGQFFQRERVSRYTLVANAPFAVTASGIKRALGGATPTTLSGGSASPSGGMDPRAILPNTIQWNLTLEQELAPNTVMQVSYVGNRGIHLTSSYDVNSIAPANWAAASFVTGGAQSALRPYSNFGSLAYWSHNGDSNYSGLQSLFRTQIHSFRMQAAYTWSHAIADVLTDDSSGGTGAQSFTYFANPRFDRGNAATNRPNIFVANGTYFAPKLQNHTMLVRDTLGGWEITGITSAQSGNSYTIYQGASENSANVVSGATGAGALNALFQTGLTGNQRPLLTPGQSCNSSGRKGSQIYNPTGFTLIGYQIGTMQSNMAPRGACQGPRLVNTDFSVDKNWKVKERVTVQFRLDFFDVFNHANFRADQGSFTPISSVNCGPASGGKYQPCSVSNNVITSQTRNGSFGVATGLVGNAERQLQYGLHIEF
ncbi:MAG: TonB-dependent receptor [Acidobacteriota bacterium]|nr:TonB-dependent receptor [Acidobacteriota bacterium]